MTRHQLVARLAVLVALIPGCALAQQSVAVTDPSTGNQAAVSGGALSVTLSGGGGVTAATPISTTTLASSLVVKASAGKLFSFEAVPDSTLYAATWWLMIFNATSAPGDGAVTPLKCYQVPAGVLSFPASFASNGVAFSTGITLVASTTGCLTKTASAHAFISGDYE